MLNNIKQIFEDTHPFDDPTKKVINRLPKEIVDNYINKTKLRHAGVLFGLQDNGENNPDLYLTKRTKQLKNHGGEISLPGGTFDQDYDKNIIDTALRESEEEIGLQSEHAEILGFIDPQISLGSGFIVTPLIARIHPSFTPKINTYEVEELFKVPLEFFLDQENLSHEYRVFDGNKWSVYSYKYEEHYIWGLTAQIIRKFCKNLMQ